MKHLILNFDQQKHQINIIKVHEGSEQEANIVGHLECPGNFKVISYVNDLCSWFDELGIEEPDKTFKLAQILNRSKLVEVWLVVSMSIEELHFGVLGIFLGDKENALSEGHLRSKLDIIEAFNVNTAKGELREWLINYNVFSMKTIDKIVADVSHSLGNYL